MSPDRGDEGKFFGLSNNITPRSGARVSRLDSESPNTPDVSAKTRSKSRIGAGALRDTERRGLGVQSPTPPPIVAIETRTNVSTLVTSARRTSGGSHVSQAQDEAKFFRADDVRSVLSTTKPQSNKSRPGLTTQLTSPHFPPRNVADKGNVDQDKFFRADDLKNQSTPRPKLLLKALTFSTASASPSATAHTPSDLIWTSSQVIPPYDDKRVAAPATLPSLRSESSLVSDTQSNSIDRRRSSSLNVNRLDSEYWTKHRKSSSASSITVGSELNKLQDGDKEEQQKHSASPGQLSQRPIMTVDRRNSIIDAQSSRSSDFTAAPAVVNEAQTESVTRPVFHRVHTRGLSEMGNIRPLTQEELDAAASARRERKVLDLEISNSSLLAINRTLEKELRKQNSELRRFRRLSQSGRLSLIPSNRIISSHSISTLETLDEHEVDHDDSNHDDSSASTDEEDEDEDEAVSESNSSTMNSLDLARRRARDEKKLLNDLARHRQLLVDSQKLTQSIQRCVNSTEEMIKEGQGALAYRVGIGELGLGGRVLRHDDNDDNDDNGDNDEEGEDEEENDESMSEVDTSDLTDSFQQFHKPPDSQRTQTQRQDFPWSHRLQPIPSKPNTAVSTVT